MRQSCTCSVLWLRLQTCLEYRWARSWSISDEQGELLDQLDLVWPKVRYALLSTSWVVGGLLLRPRTGAQWLVPVSRLVEVGRTF